MQCATVILGAIGWPQIVVIIVVVLILFGGRKIPELMRGIGGGIKEFKGAIKDDEGDKKDGSGAKSNDATKEEDQKQK